MAGRLGVGRHDFFVVARGGARDRRDITPWVGSYEWHRALRGTSTAAVSVSRGARSRLQGVRSWSHELHVLRNGRKVWEGPIVGREPGEGMVLDAADVSAWLGHRLPHANLEWPAPTELTEIARALVEQAFTIPYDLGESPADLNVAPLARYWPTAVATTVEFIAMFRKPFILDHINDLADKGLDWTALGRALLFGAGYAPPLQTLTDEAFTQQISGKEDGEKAISAAFVNVGAQSASWGSSSAAIRFFGFLEDEEQPQIAETPEAVLAYAQGLIAEFGPSPFTLNVESGIPLAPSAPVTIDALIPGAPARIISARMFEPVDQWMRLASVDVTGSADTPEQVSVAFLPAGSSAEAAA